MPANALPKGLRARRAVAASRPGDFLAVGAREAVEGLYQKVQKTIGLATQWLNDLGYHETGLYLDEVALLLPEGGEGKDWFEMMLGRVGKRGISYFNTAEDTVGCEPLPSTYRVRYDFFLTDLGPRLELLRILSGHSPLHHLYSVASGRDAAVVHASFKLPTQPDYDQVLMDLREKGWVCGQSCVSAYGRFSYWRTVGSDGPLLWLKPRVNLRDMAFALRDPEDEDEEEGIDWDEDEDDHRIK